MGVYTSIYIKILFEIWIGWRCLPSRVGVCSRFLRTGEFFLLTVTSSCSGGISRFLFDCAKRSETASDATYLYKTKSCLTLRSWHGSLTFHHRVNTEFQGFHLCTCSVAQQVGSCSGSWHRVCLSGLPKEKKKTTAAFPQCSGLHPVLAPTKGWTWASESDCQMDVKPLQTKTVFSSCSLKTGQMLNWSPPQQQHDFFCCCCCLLFNFSDTFPATAAVNIGHICSAFFLNPENVHSVKIWRCSQWWEHHMHSLKLFRDNEGLIDEGLWVEKWTQTSLHVN